jgi:pyruvate kinase
MNMVLPKNKTKIVCTIGPASESPQVMEQMLLAGMNVARLNFSHGDFESHKRAIDNLRAASRATERQLAIMADLSGPKMRIGKLRKEPVELEAGEIFTLTTREILGDVTGASINSSQCRQTRRRPVLERRFYPTRGFGGYPGECTLQSSCGR